MFQWMQSRGKLHEKLHEGGCSAAPCHSVDVRQLQETEKPLTFSV